jgi:hypothetical protein
MKHAFATALDMGHHVSNALVAEAIADGFVVLVTEHLPLQNGHGPRFQGDDELIVTDLQLSKNGHTINVDAKAKTKASLYRHTGEWQHAVDQPILDNYKKSRKLTGIPMLLVFRETGPYPWEGTDTYSINLDDVKEDTRLMGVKPMGYINRSDMVEGWLDSANRLCGVTPRFVCSPNCEFCTPFTKEHQ